MEKNAAINTLEWMRERFLKSENVDISPWVADKKLKQIINDDFAEALRHGIEALKKS